ncbi:hypothetical protein HK405_010447, partial [Cladochytrium tenue]
DATTRPETGIASTVSAAVSTTALDRPDIFGVSAVDTGDHRQQQYDNVPQDQEQNLQRRQRRQDLQIRDGDNGSGSSKTPERGSVAAAEARLSRRSPTVDMTHATPFTGLAGTVLQAATSSVFAGWYQGDATQKAQKGLQEAVKGEHEAGKPSTTQRWAHTLTGGRAGRIENSSKYKFYQEHASNWCYVVSSCSASTATSPIDTVRSATAATVSASSHHTPPPPPPAELTSDAAAGPVLMSLMFRLANRASRAVADAVLSSRTTVTVAKAKLMEAESEWLPLLQHYAGFLSGSGGGGGGGAVTAVLEQARLDGEVGRVLAVFEQRETEDTWMQMDAALAQLTAFARESAQLPGFVTSLQPLKTVLPQALATKHTRLVRTALTLVEELALLLGERFEPLADFAVPALLRLCTRTNEVVVSCASATLLTVFEHAGIPSCVPLLTEALQSSSKSLRISAADCLNSALEVNSPAKLDVYGDVVEAALRLAITDAAPEVGTLARTSFELFQTKLPARLDRLNAIATLPPSASHVYNSRLSKVVEVESHEAPTSVDIAYIESKLKSSDLSVRLRNLEALNRLVTASTLSEANPSVVAEVRMSLPRIYGIYLTGLTDNHSKCLGAATVGLTALAEAHDCDDDILESLIPRVVGSFLLPLSAKIQPGQIMLGRRLLNVLKTRKGSALCAMSAARALNNPEYSKSLRTRVGCLGLLAEISDEEWSLLAKEKGALLKRIITCLLAVAGDTNRPVQKLLKPLFANISTLAAEIFWGSWVNAKPAERNNVNSLFGVKDIFLNRKELEAARMK